MKDGVMRDLQVGQQTSCSRTSSYETDDEERRGQKAGLPCNTKHKRETPAPTHVQSLVSRALVLCTVLARSRE